MSIEGSPYIFIRPPIQLTEPAPLRAGVSPASPNFPKEVTIYDTVKAIEEESKKASKLFVDYETGANKLIEMENDLENLNQQLTKDPSKLDLQKIKAQLSAEIGTLKETVKNLSKEHTQSKKNVRVIEQSLLKLANKMLSENLLEDLPVKVSRSNPEGSLDEQYDQINKHCQLLSNCLTYQMHFLAEARGIVEREKKLIIDKFGGTQADLLAKADINLQLLSADRHNFGKTPLLLTFQIDGKELLKVVYKPRNAETDMEILRLFSDLNKLRPVDSDATLPFYEIIPTKDGKGSFWEYVGKNLSSVSYPDNHLQTLSDSSVRDKAQKNLALLECVCRAANIKDLHFENIRFDELTGLFIPVDLEVVTPRDRTRLYEVNPKDENLPSLSEREIDRIKQFIETQKNLISRYVPIPTQIFSNKLLELEGPQELTKMVIDELKENKLYVKMERAETLILEGIKEDFSRLDIPIFLRNEQGIFYGSIRPENLIAKRR